LILASWHGHVEIVRALLQAGADPNKQNELGHTALHCAIEFKKRKVVELLCEYKANVELKDKDGITCFDLARMKYSTLSSWYQDSEGKAILEMAEAAAKKIRKDSLRIPVEPSKPKRDVKDIAKQLKRNEKNGSSVNLSSSSANRIESPTNKIENKSEK
jgi:regulator of RNase E activity RraB